MRFIASGEFSDGFPIDTYVWYWCSFFPGRVLNIVNKNSNVIYALLATATILFIDKDLCGNRVKAIVCHIGK